MLIPVDAYSSNLSFEILRKPCVIFSTGKNIFSSFSGFVVDKLKFLNTPENLHNDWAIFFIITSIMVIPSLIFLWVIKDKLSLNEK